MPYPDNIEQKLEFNQIRQLITANCISEMGAEFVTKIRFANRYDVVEKMLLQTQDFTRIINEDTPFPTEHYFNIKPYLNKAQIAGVFLLEDELHQMSQMVQTFVNVCKYFEERNEKYPHAAALFAGVAGGVHLFA